MNPNKQPENIVEALAIANEWNFKRQARIEEMEKELAEAMRSLIAIGHKLSIENAEQFHTAAYAQGRIIDAIIEQSVESQKELAEAREDAARLDWLDNFIQCGCADFGFELDGGVYLQLNQPSSETIDIREVSDIRAAIDAARAREGKG